jgi:hypothetical protein
VKLDVVIVPTLDVTRVPGLPDRTSNVVGGELRMSPGFNAVAPAVAADARIPVMAPTAMIFNKRFVFIGQTS